MQDEGRLQSPPKALVGAVLHASEDTPASIRLPKNFQPVGVSKNCTPSFSATRSSAPLVGMLRATPCAHQERMRSHSLSATGAGQTAAAGSGGPCTAGARSCGSTSTSFRKSFTVCDLAL